MPQIAEPLSRQLKSATLSLQNDAAANRMLLAGRQLSDALLELRYRPDQPRAPKGTPEGGQWVDDLAMPRPNRQSVQHVAQTDSPIGPPPSRDASFYQVDLQAEERRTKRSHAFSKHVGKTLVELMLPVAAGLLKPTQHPAEGTFIDLRSANELVSIVLRSHPELVEKAVAGNHRVTIESLFPFPTGVEAFWLGGEDPPVFRPTFRVRILLAFDNTSPRKYVVITAFPMNSEPDEIFTGVDK